MRGDLSPEVELWVFGSPGGLQVPTFGSVGFTLTLIPKWGYDNLFDEEVEDEGNIFNSGGLWLLYNII